MLNSAATSSNPLPSSGADGRTYPYAQVVHLLGIPETAMARLCHAFRLPAAAYAHNSQVLIQGETPFTQEDFDRLAAIYEAVLAGDSFKTIRQRFARHDALMRRSSLPSAPGFLAVLQHSARAASEPTPQRATPTPRPNPPVVSSSSNTSQPLPPAGVLASLALRVQTTPLQVPKAPPVFADVSDLKALYPTMGHAQRMDLPALSPEQTHRERPVCLPQTTGHSLSLHQTMVHESAVPSGTLRQAFMRRTDAKAPLASAGVQATFEAF